MGIQVSTENVIFPLTPEALELVSSACGLDISANGGILVTQDDKTTYVPAYQPLRVSGDFEVKNNTGSHIEVTLTVAGDAASVASIIASASDEDIVAAVEDAEDVESAESTDELPTVL